MDSRLTTHNQKGFSIFEMLIAVTVMLIVTAGVVSLMRSSTQIATTTYEMTDAQESMRVAQEYVSRDLLNAGDGLKSLTPIIVPKAFAQAYLTLNPIVDPVGDAAMPTGTLDFGILTTDNNVPTGTVVAGATPAGTTVRTLPDGTGTDRQTILEIDPQFVAITPSAINATGTVVTLPSGTAMTQFTIGEIYFFSSSQGGTFATITDLNSGSRTLTFANGGVDIGLNKPGSAGADTDLDIISKSGTVATSMQRIQIVHYYVDSNGLLMRRVFGIKGAIYRDSIIAEHVVNVQYKYSLETTDSSGNVVQPTDSLQNKNQRVGVRSVEVTVTVETPHLLQNNQRAQLVSSVSTSVRNMQFRQAAQPTPTP
jgi:prepilin-type N-terminal cleavage/methylation domain-containing protein